MKKLSLLIALIICNEFFAFGFFNQPKYKLYNKSDGLNNNTVSAIFQDREGYLWLGTDIGLTRSDGVNFRHYPFSEAGGSFITKIYQLKDSLLWCWSNSYIAPVCFDSFHGKDIPIEGPDESYLQSLKDFCILDNKLYALQGSKLVHLPVEYKEASIVLQAEEIPFDKEIKRVFCGNNSLYLLHKDELVIFNPQTGSRKALSIASLGITASGQVSHIKAFGDYLFLYGPAIMPVCHNLKSGKNTTLKVSDPLVDIQQVDGKRFIYATWNSISVLTFSSEDYTAAQQDSFGLFDNLAPYARIFRNSINELYYDQRNQVLWVGITGRGLMKISFRGERLKYIEIPSNIKSVNGLTQDMDGYIWISTDTKGVFRSTTNQLSSKMHFEQWPEAKNGRYVQYQDQFGGLWFGDSYGNVIQLNTNTGKKNSLKIECPAEEGTITAENINALYLNSRNDLWVAADNGLFIFDMNTRKLLAYMPNNSKTGNITAICQDGGGTMWLGTERGVHMAVREGNTVNLTSGFENSANVAANKVLALYVNNFNQLYASYEDKTIHIDTKSKEVVEALMLHRDYSSGHIRCITDDGSGCTWLGTASGVVMVNNGTLESYLYELAESFIEVHRLKDGELLWATSNGLVYFRPDEIKHWVGNRELTISDLEINYRTLGDDTPRTFNKQLQFKHNENNLHIYVSDMRFGASRSKIEYRLLPVEQEWKSTYGNCIELKNLKQGKYTLELRNPHITEQEPPVTQMKFVVKPLWIFSFWGIFISAATLLAILVLSYIFVLLRLRNRKNLSAMESRLLIKIDEQNQREERALLRSRLRHEIIQNLRTPISLIIAPLKEITQNVSLSEDVKLKSNIALLNSVIVQEICTRLEDLFLLEKDEIYKVAPYEISKISNSTVSPLREIFNTSTVRVYFDKDRRSEKILWVDRTRISFLLRSLLVHTLQYLEYSGEMWLDLKEETVNGTHFCIFAIKTRKIAKIQKDRTFSLCKDYDEAINQKLLGWQLLQYIATMHKGDVIFKESVENGLEVSLHLPFLTKEDWKDKENVQIVEPIIAENEQEALASIIVNESSVDLNMEEDGDDLQQGKIKLLVIEDNPDIRLYMKVMFGKQYNVLFAENGVEGLKIATEEIPNLILTDVMMPVMDGYEVLRIIKENATTCHIPVVLLTALTGEEDIIKGFDLGADDYITKPFNPEILRAKVRQLVKGRGELKQIYSKLLTSTSESLDEIESHKAEEDPLIIKINELVIANIQNQDFNVKELASMLFMSQPTLYRKVKQITGFTIIEVVRTVRLKQAAQLLKTRKYGIQEVAELVGYNDVPTFRKHFVALYGTTPSSFSASSGGEQKN